MRHRNSGRQLSRNASHRHAMLRNMATSLLQHETIRTTVPKAKELRRVVEPLITLAKVDSIGYAAPGALAPARCRRGGEAVRRLGTALQSARRRLHANPQDGTAAGRFGRHGADAVGGFRPGRGRKERRQEGRQGAEGGAQEDQGKESRGRRRRRAAARSAASGARKPPPKIAGACMPPRLARQRLVRMHLESCFRACPPSPRHCPRSGCRRKAASSSTTAQSICARRSSACAAASSDSIR